MRWKGEGRVSFFCPTFPSTGNGADQEMIPAVSHRACYLVTVSTCLLLLGQDKLCSWEDKKAIPKVVTPFLGCLTNGVLQYHSDSARRICSRMVSPRKWRAHKPFSFLPLSQALTLKRMGRSFLQKWGHPCRRWGSRPCWVSERWDCRLSWLWVELPAIQGAIWGWIMDFLGKRPAQGRQGSQLLRLTVSGFGTERIAFGCNHLKPRDW